MLAWILAVVLLIGCWAYIYFTPKDVDPYFISHQSSISSTKQPGESAVLRSLVNEHGRALLGSMHPLNQFQCSHLWDEAESFNITYITQTGQVHNMRNFGKLVARIQKAICNYPPNSEIPVSFGVGIEAFAAFFAIVLSGRKIKILPTAIQTGDMDDTDLTAAGNESAVEDMEEESIILKHAEFKFAQGISGIDVKKDADTSVVLPIFNEDEDDDNTIVPQVETVAPQSEIIRVGTHEDTMASVSQVDLGVAVAAQLTALGGQHRWNEKDVVFMAPGPLTIYSIVTMITALSAKAQILFVEPGPLMTAPVVLQRTKPTILVSDDVSMRSLSKQVDNFQLVSWLRYGLIRARLSRGAITKKGMIPGFKSVRLIHSATGTNPYSWLDNNEMSNLRVLTGTQVIHVYNPDEGLPVCQTAIGDYRSSRKLPGVVMGPPLPGIELKSRNGDNLFILRANHESWTSINSDRTEGAKLSKDGCLYVPEKRTDFSDYYFYTGELK